MEGFFFSLKTQRTARKTHRTGDETMADVFDYMERFYNPKRRHSTIVMEFEMQAETAYTSANRIGGKPDVPSPGEILTSCHTELLLLGNS
jgi:hypothetical protein